MQHDAPRPSPNGNSRVSDQHEARRRLADLIASELDPSITPDNNGASPDMTVRRAELNEALETAVAGLDTKDRLILQLRFHDDLSGREIADVVGLPTPFHAYRRLNAGLAQLRQALEARGIFDARP